MDFEGVALIEANELTDLQYIDFLDELEKTPSPRAPINGKEARLAFEFMEDTGLRVNEMINIKKQDIDFKTRVLIVTRPKSEKRCKCSRWKNKNVYSRVQILDYVDPKCKICFGKGKYKKPQKTTITPRLIDKVLEYCKDLKDYELLFPVSRQSLWKWGKKAGIEAKINIFQEKDQRKIEGIFLHLFRALCSKRMVRDAKDEEYRDQLVALKLRHSFVTVTDRYTRIDINKLLKWEDEAYNFKIKDSVWK